MPVWIEDRVKHIMKKNPSMPESMAWGIATKQSYAANKAPSSYGTKEGRDSAKKEYKKSSKEYVQTADPKIKTSSILSCFAELEKIALASMSEVAKMKSSPTLTSPAKLVSKLPKVEVKKPDEIIDPVNRNLTPPPVTVGG